MLKVIKFGDFSYNCVEVFELNKLLVNDASMIDKFTPNVLVNETFEKWLSLFRVLIYNMNYYIFKYHSFSMIEAQLSRSLKYAQTL